MRFKRLINTNGYTLLEALFQLAVLIITAHLIVLILIVYFQSFNLQKVRDQLEWELFVVDLNIYFERAHSVQVDKLGKTIEYRDPQEFNSTYIIQVREKHIARASLDGGHEIVLPHVTYAKFTLKNGILHVYAIMKSGQIRERSFVVATNKK